MTTATGLTEGKVTTSAPTRIESNGTNAYVIMPAIYFYKEHGKPSAKKRRSPACCTKKPAHGRS